MENQASHHRPSWDEYFLNIMDMVGTRGTCDRGRSGCVIVKDKRIISTGYVGSPIGISHCDEIGHEMSTVTHPDGHQSRHCIRTTHAEQNAICQAARVGIALEGSTLYCKMTPCYACGKMIINAGIARVVALQDYHAGARSKEIFAEAGVQFKVMNNEITTYSDMKPGESAVPKEAIPVPPLPVMAPAAVEMPAITSLPKDEPAKIVVAETPIFARVEPEAVPEPVKPIAQPPLSSYAASFTPIGKILKADIPL
jgi:dCMP deaminase